MYIKTFLFPPQELLNKNDLVYFFCFIPFRLHFKLHVFVMS